VASKPPISKELKLDRWTGREEERTPLAQSLHQARECLTTASFAIELVKTSDPEQTELLLRASKLLTEAMELLREPMDGQKDENRAPEKTEPGKELASSLPGRC
jgi:hypothetical protein